jgi:hypothetical protein
LWKRKFVLRVRFPKSICGEVIKYRNKIRGGEIERSEVKVTGNIQLNWGTDSGLAKLEQ